MKIPFFFFFLIFSRLVQNLQICFIECLSNKKDIVPSKFFFWKNSQNKRIIEKISINNDRLQFFHILLKSRKKLFFYRTYIFNIKKWCQEIFMTVKRKGAECDNMLERKLSIFKRRIKGTNWIFPFKENLFSIRCGGIEWNWMGSR